MTYVVCVSISVGVSQGRVCYQEVYPAYLVFLAFVYLVEMPVCPLKNALLYPLTK